MNYNSLNRRQRARLGRNEWIRHHAAVQNEMQDRILELTGQIIDLRAQVQQLNSEVQRKDSIIRGQAHRIGSLHDELFNAAVRSKNGHDCHASTQTAAASCDAFAQTVTAESCDTSAQTATAESCDASTQTATAESCHALTQTDDIPDDVTKNAQVELTRQLTDARSKIEMLEKARADVMSFARGTINSAKEEQREMMDHIKKDYDEKIAQRDAVIAKLETHIQSLKRQAESSTTKPLDPVSSGPTPHSEKNNTATVPLQGNEISLGPVRIGTVEKNGSRGIRFINTSQCSKSITVVYPGNPKPYHIALNPMKERVFGVTSKFQDAKEAHLSSEVGERKTLPLVWRSLPRFDDHKESSKVATSESNRTESTTGAKKNPLMTPTRQSRRIQAAKKASGQAWSSTSPS